MSAKSTLKPCAAFEQYKQDDDKEACVSQFIGVLTSTGTYSLMLALANRSPGERQEIITAYFGRIRDNLMAMPITRGMPTEVNVVCLRKL